MYQPQPTNNFTGNSNSFDQRTAYEKNQMDNNLKNNSMMSTYPQVTGNSNSFDQRTAYEKNQMDNNLKNNSMMSTYPQDTLPQNGFIATPGMQQQVTTVPSAPQQPLMGPQIQPMQMTLPPSAPQQPLMGPQIQPMQMTLPPSAPQQPLMGPNSTVCVCPSCNRRISSKTSRKTKESAWWSCLLLFFCGCSCGCCLIPFVMDSCLVINHNCPGCNAYLGQYSS